MNKDNILFIAANTSRSQAYAQTFANNGIKLGQVIVFETLNSTQLGKSNRCQLSNIHAEVQLPDPTIPLIETIKKLTKNISIIEADSINHPSILNEVKAAVKSGAKIAIYSGYGGQLVPAELLDVGLPFLHAHSGWLPDYRGSTTIYYSLLEEHNCGVSIIKLASAIDQGPIVARRKYPPPPPGLDIDYFYDSAIRADLMKDVVMRWLDFKQLNHVDEEGCGADYYIIHPLLKHLAILNL